MAKLQGRKNKGTSFGKRQDADDAFRKKKKERGSYGKSDGGSDKPRGERKSFSGGRSSGGRGGFNRAAPGGRGRSEGSGAGRGYGRSQSSEGGERRGFSRRNEAGGERRGFNRSEGGEGSRERGGFRGSRYDGGARKFSGGRRDERSGDKKPYRSNRFSEGKGEDKKPFRSDRFSDKEGGDRKRSFSSGKPRRSDGDSPRGERRSSGGSYQSRGRRENSEGKSRSDRPFKKDKFEKRSFVESKVENERRRSAESVGEESKAPKTQQADGDGLIRLNKFISNSGVCSRREADELIKMGVITVNGTTITEMGYKVKPTDEIRHEGKKLTAEKPVYILLNKPKGFITTTDDPQERNTVMQLIAGACKERVYPVGRLDRNTTGLLLLTNDGELTDKLTHPSFNAKKIYKVELDKPLTKADFQRIVDGVKLEEGTAMVDDLAIVSDDNLTVGIELHIGWNHIVRRIFNALEYEVVKLDRVVYAGLDKKDLKRGQWRFLKNDEIVRLKHFK
jgi:23S rRNA pseudouridine2605 synthase